MASYSLPVADVVIDTSVSKAWRPLYEGVVLISVSWMRGFSAGRRTNDLNLGIVGAAAAEFRRLQLTAADVEDSKAVWAMKGSDMFVIEAFLKLMSTGLDV